MLAKRVAAVEQMPALVTSTMTKSLRAGRCCGLEPEQRLEDHHRAVLTTWRTHIDRRGATHLAGLDIACVSSPTRC